MNRIQLSVLLVMAFTLAGCSDTDPWSPESASAPTADQNKAVQTSELRIPIGQFNHANRDARWRQTIQAAHKLERAVWRFADDNDGVFPSNIPDINLAGKTLFDYLPGKKLLLNPYTRYRTNPVYGAAAFAGSVAYLEIRDELAYSIGFTITAMGEDYPSQYLEIERYMADR